MEGQAKGGGVTEAFSGGGGQIAPLPTPKSTNSLQNYNYVGACVTFLSSYELGRF